MKPFDTPYARVGEAQRLETATEWLMRLRENPDDDEVIVGWVQWCERDPRNQHAFERVQQLWQLSGGLAAEVVAGELTGPVPLALRGWRPHVRRAGFGLRRALRRPAGLAAAALMILVMGTAAGGWQLRGNWAWLPAPTDAEAVVAAPARPVHHAELADGSRMQLAARSTVAVEYSPVLRQLELQAGEAYFTVQSNPQRPFVVKVGAVRVRAVGTAFNVRRAGERIVVTVTEGVVDVFRDAVASEPLRVRAGGEVTWETAAANAPVVASVDPAQALAWREGRLEYTDEPLSAVIADFNRYADREVRIVDPRVADMRFSGTLLTRLTGQWLHTLPRLFPIAIREQGDHLVIEALYQG